MEIKNLQYFLAVAQFGNITKAAASLHISQPALSRAIIQLEDELGVTLLIRSKRKITLTGEGNYLKSRAEQIIGLVTKTAVDLSSDESDLIGVLNIGTAECLATHITLPKVIGSFSQDHPQVTYNFYTGDADHIKERLDQGLLDVGILIEPVDIDKYDFIRLKEVDRWGVIVNAANPLASQATIAPGQLPGLPLITTNRELLQNEIKNWFTRTNDELNYVATYTMISNAISLVINGIGNVITIEGAYYNYHNPAVKFIPFEPPLTSRAVLVWPKNQTQAPLMKKFIDLFYHALNA